MQNSSSRYGTHRVIEPAGVLPQAAWKIGNRKAIAADELLVDVDGAAVDWSDRVTYRGRTRPTRS